ncbi:MAG: hypothetical protein WCJ35_25510 [Planctomycetota bacterium]
MSPTPNRSRLLPGFVLATVVICLTLFTPARAGAQVGLLPPSYPEDMGLANSLAFSPDGKLLACGCCGPYNDIKDYDILQIWDVATGRETARLKTYGFAAFSPDGKTLAGRGDKGRLQLWEAQSHRIRLDDEAGPYFNVLAFSPDSRLLLTGNDSPQFTLRDAGYGTVLYEEKLPVTVLSRGTVTIQCPIFIYDARFAPDGKEIALAVTTLGAVSKPSQIYLGQIIRDRTGGTRSGKIGLKWRLKIAVPAPRGVCSLSYAPDGQRLAAASNDASVRVFNARDGRQLREFCPPWDTRCWESPMYHVAFSPDGKTLAGAGPFSSPGIRLWDAATGKELHRLRLKGDAPDRPEIFQSAEIFQSIAFSPDGKLLASAGAQRDVILWDVATGQRTKVIDRTIAIRDRPPRPALPRAPAPVPAGVAPPQTLINRELGTPEPPDPSREK